MSERSLKASGAGAMSVSDRAAISERVTFINELNEWNELELVKFV
jgi:hypothetical protein